MTTGHVWAPDRRNLAPHEVRVELVHLAKRLRSKADAMEAVDEDGAKKLRQTAYALQQRNALTKVKPELEAHPKVTLTVDDFDQDDFLLNTPAGIVDLRSGAMRQPDPDRLMSKSTAVAPRDMETPEWDQFLQDATGGNEELQDYLQRLVGYSLTGSTQEQILAFVHGPTRTGKSTFLETIAHIFGTYHEAAAADTFASSSNRGVPADIAALAGARLVTAAETQEGRSWDTQRVKSLTGGDQVSARFLYNDFFTFTPKHQIVIVGNYEPEVEGVDDAIMRRLHIVPFEQQVPEDEVDRLLGERLKEEGPGILQWAIEGCLEWLEEGLSPPAVVQQRTEEYREEEDLVGLFIEEHCELEEGAFTSRRDLFDAWRRWCGRRGEKEAIGTLKTLHRRFRPKMGEYGFTNGREVQDRKYRRGYEGLALKDDAEEVFSV